MRIDRSPPPRWDGNATTALLHLADVEYQRFGDGRRPLLRRLSSWLAPSSATGLGPWQRALAWLDGFFSISARGSTPATEVWAGGVAFMTMSYVMLVIPVLLHKANEEMNFEALLTATALSAATGSFLAGVLGNAPVGVTPGLRLNAYFTFGFCRTLDVSWGEALSCCFVSGSLLLLLAVLGVCNWVAREVLTDHLKKAIAVAMGIFQAMIGFQMLGLVSPHEEEYMALATARFRWHGEGAFLCFVVATFCLVSGLLVASRVNGALLISIFLVAAGSWAFGLFEPPAAAFAAPRFDAVLSLDFSGWLHRKKLGNLVVGSSVMLLIAIFDVMGVQYGLYSIAGLLKHGVVPKSSGIVASTALGTIVGSLLGTGPLVIANESSAGIVEGARTGLSAVVVSALFAFSAFLTPLLTAVPDMAAAAPLILIGAFMMEPSRSIAWDDLRVSIPCFLAITLVPHSIHSGMTAGIVVDCLLGFVARWRREEPAAAAAPPPAAAEEGQAPQEAAAVAARGGAAAGGAVGGALGGAFAAAMAAAPAPVGRHSNSPYKEKRLATPHSMVSVGVGLKDAEKLERVRELLHDLGPPCTGMRASETWEIALRRALETYLEGMRPKVVARATVAASLPRSAATGAKRQCPLRPGAA